MINEQQAYMILDALKAVKPGCIWGWRETRFFIDTGSKIVFYSVEQALGVLRDAKLRIERSLAHVNRVLEQFEVEGVLGSGGED